MDEHVRTDISDEIIVDEIKNILETVLKVNPSIVNNAKLDDLFVGKEFRLTDVDLFYLFFAVEEKFDICIDASSIVHNEFGSIGGVLGIVKNELKNNLCLN